MDIVEYRGWNRNLRLSNEQIEIIATLEVGPRIISLRVPGGENVLKNYDQEMGRSGEEAWMIRGGHRLWIAPEHPVASYWPDNGPVEVEPLETGAYRLRPLPEDANGIQKEIDVSIAPDAAEVRLVHRVINIAREARTLAPWAPTVMAPGGTGIVSLPPRGSHPEDLLPNQTIILWPYTDLADERVAMGTRSIRLTHSAERGPIKLGLSNPEGWVAYAVAGCLFVKTCPFDAAAAYPDMGSSTQLFSNEEMLEVESLAPLTTLEPGSRAEHTETWHLWGDVPAIASEADVEAHVRPRVEGLDAIQRPPERP